jgi:replicative DNA helicase
MGAGVRNYGFIEKSLDVVSDNPELFPVNFNVTRFADNVRTLDVYRQLFWVLEKFLQTVNESMLVSADASMHDALRVYRVLQELTRSGVRGAEPLFRALNRFFQRPRHPEQGEEPTIPELERDFNKMVHGKEDGEIILRNESPHMQGGLHEIIDTVHKGRSAFKGTEEGEVKE